MKDNSVTKIVVTIFSLMIVGLVVVFSMKYMADQKNIAVTAQDNQTTAANIEKESEREAAVAANATDAKNAQIAKLIADAKVTAAAKVAADAKVAATILATATKKADDARDASAKITINNNVSAVATASSAATSNASVVAAPAVFDNIPANYTALSDNTYNFTMEYPNFLTDVTDFQNDQGFEVTSSDQTTSLSTWVNPNYTDTLSAQYIADMSGYNAIKIVATNYGTDDDWYLISWLDGDNTDYEKVEVDSVKQLEYISLFSCPSVYVNSYQPYIDRFSAGFFSN